MHTVSLLADIALAELDLDGEWDPEKHDLQMAGIYNDDAGEDVEQDMEKPVWKDDIDISNIMASSSSTHDRKKRKKRGDDDAMDVGVKEEVDTHGNDEETDTQGSKNRKLGAYMDEVYDMEFNDMVCLLIIAVPL